MVINGKLIKETKSVGKSYHIIYYKVRINKVKEVVNEKRLTLVIMLLTMVSILTLYCGQPAKYI